MLAIVPSVDRDAEIERLSRSRQEIWSGLRIGEPGEIKSISDQLAKLYEERRLDAGENPGRSRTDVIRRARVESELERLMSR